MKTSRFLIVALLLLAAVVPASAQRKIQVALLLDTSGSMDGLIEQAKSQLWSIVNEMASARAEGRAPDIEIALYEYGNDGLSAQHNYIRQVLPLSKDLDKISEALFALRTNGGSEYCGAVIAQSLADLAWSPSNRALKLIYIAGNEPFNQGGTDYKAACKNALSHGVVVNTIFCGDYNEGVNSFWKDGAELGEGKYFNINANDATVYVETPYDQQINELNGRLNTTYIAFGEMGRYKKENQLLQDNNAGLYSPANAAERTVSKSSAAYRADDWDLVDAVNHDSISVKDIKQEQLPEELKGKNAEELEAYVAQKTTERTEIQNQIQELSKKRGDYIAEAMKKKGEDHSLNSAMIKALRERAQALGFTFVQP